MGGDLYSILVCVQKSRAGGGVIVNRERGNDPSSLLDYGLYSEREVCGGGIIDLELNYI